MQWFYSLTWSWIAVGIITFVVLMTTGVRAPYGRHTSKHWGPLIDNRLGWFIMELPALLICPALAIWGPSEKTSLIGILVFIWILHYFNRTVIFPLRIKTAGKKMPVLIVLNAIFFNTVNGFLNGYYLGYMEAGSLELDIHTALGLLLFIVGMIINQRADSLLISLRKSNKGYQIPKGWLFDYISCPNLFGEILEWTGFALLAWNLPAASFAIWTFCNLVPRAMNHHSWYREKFENYPSDRKAIFPKLL